MDPLHPRPVKGRGALSNRSGRFEAACREGVDDGWGDPGAEDLPPWNTVLAPDSARSIITTNDSPDVPFDQSINPYRGCEHGCIYCFARPSHAYLGLSPGLDFETKIFVKHDAAQLLDAALRRPGYKPAMIAIGANTDPYQPVERKLKITRGVLEVLAAFNNPFGIITKSALILRDRDIIAKQAALGQAMVCISVTTLDADLARRLEPRAATPARRLQAVRGLAEAGIPVVVLASPMIPALNDHELETILEAAAGAGATAASYTLLRLPLELKALFEEWLRTHVPNRADRVLNLIRQSRGGLLYDSSFGTRMRGEGVHAKLLAARFAAACRKHDLNLRRYALDTSRFSVPLPTTGQLRLF